MQEIDDQLQIYRVEFSKENEFAFVKNHEPEVDDLFKDLKKIEYDCTSMVRPLENRVKVAEQNLKEAKIAENKAHEEYLRQVEREEQARRNYEKEMRKANENISRSKTDRYISDSAKHLRKADKALSNAADYKREVISGNSDILYKRWQQRIEEVKEAEERLEDLSNKLKHVKQALEYLTYCDYEKEHYYAALAQHEFHSKRLESFQCIINNYREFSKNNPEIEGLEELYKEILNEVDLITKMSIKQYIYLEKEKITCSTRKKESKNGCKEGWDALANRYTVIIRDDRTNPRLKRPVTIKMAEYLLEDAEDKNRKSKFAEPDIGEEKIASVGVSKNTFYEGFYNSLIDSRKEIISQVDAYFKYAKDNMEKYPQKMEDIINKVSDMLKSKRVKYEKIEKLFYSSFEIYEKENEKIEEFMKDEEKHPIHNYCNILQDLKLKIENEYYSPLNADIENTVIDPLCFGLDRYNEERELDCKKERRYNVLVEKEINDLEYNILPFRKYKQQLILEGFKNECLSIYPSLLHIMKSCNPDNAFTEISEKISKEITASNERLENLKNILKEIINKGKSNEKQLFQYRDEIDKYIVHSHEFDGDYHYYKIIEAYQHSIRNINSHINYERERLALVNKMIKSINLLIELINNPNGSNAIYLMQDQLLEIPPPSLEESESKTKSSLMKRNKSAKVAPIPVTMIVVKSKSRLNVEESKKEIELCESSKSIKDDKTIVSSSTTGEAKDNNITNNVEGKEELPKEDEVIPISINGEAKENCLDTQNTEKNDDGSKENEENTTEFTGEAKESNVDENNAAEAIPESIPGIPKEAKKEKPKEEENIIIEVSNAESMYRVLKNLLLWKFEILRLYFSSPFQIFYTDIVDESTYYYRLTYFTYWFTRYQNDIYGTKYQIDYDKLRYGKHGNYNWKLYKNIKKQLNNLKSKYKFIFLNIESEMEFIQRFHYTLSNFCKTCQIDCEVIIKNYNIYYNEILKLPNLTSDKSELMLVVQKLDKDIKKNLLGDTFLACCSCCIPGICFGYPYAGKKWCDEKVKNEELSREEII